MSADTNKTDYTTDPNPKKNRKRKPPDDKNPTSKLNKPNPILLSNRFETLSDESNSSEDEQEETMETSNQSNKTPPIVTDIKHLNSQEALAFINHIKSISTNLTMRYSKESVTFYPTIQTDHDNITKYLDASTINYHTYTSQHQKDKKFVIRGLPPVSLHAIAQELLELGIAAKKLSIMKQKDPKKSNTPLYYLATTPETDVTTIYSIKHLLSIKTKIVKYKNHRKVTQCYNCQGYGHGTSNCHHPPRCVKCSGNHKTKDCENTHEKPTCVNCGEEHPANYSRCATYQKHLQKIERRRQPTKKQHPPPPPPDFTTTNYPPLKARNSTWQQPSNYTFNQGKDNNEKSGIINNNSKPDDVPQVNNVDLSNISDLIHELRKLNELCDIKFIIEIIKRLNSKLKTCKDKTAQCFAVLDMLSELNGP